MSDTKEQRSVIDTFGVGAGLARSRISRQRRQQIARRIGIEGFAKNSLFFRREWQIRQVEHRRIVEAPLEDVVGDKTRGSRGRFAQLRDRLLAIRENERGLLVAKLNFAIDRQRFINTALGGLPLMVVMI